MSSSSPVFLAFRFWFFFLFFFCFFFFFLLRLCVSMVLCLVQGVESALSFFVRFNFISFLHEAQTEKMF